MWCKRVAQRCMIQLSLGLLVIIRAVLTNGHTGHVPGPPDFFLLRGPQLAVVK